MGNPISLTTETPDLNENLPEEGKSEEIKDEQPKGEVNRTDPKVCHDPSVKNEGIARLFTNQNKVNMIDGELSTNNEYDALRIDGIEYPLVVINNRNIENNEIIHMSIDYTHFLPTIYIKIYDEHQNEQKISSTQMSSIIRVIMISPVDKVYKKISLNFRILNSYVDKFDQNIISYSGEYYVEGFRTVNTTHIWMSNVCSKSKTCQQGGHINANTWEMLHRIAELTGLGFAATEKCKDVKDHIIRNIHTQRYNQFIEQQLEFSGTDIDNIFDAWVDLYGYIVMVNVPWVLKEDVKHNEITITANTGLHGTSNDLMEQEPQDVERTITNYNATGVKSNLEIESYNTEVNNELVTDGTLERIYSIKLTDNERLSTISPLDIQSKQNSLDGEYIEDYNTGKTRPVPKFDFNDDKWTGLEGGYDINVQKRIRTAYFKKLRHSILYVKLKTINFGLQRGTLVNVTICENDAQNKEYELENSSRLIRNDSDIERDKLTLPQNYNETDIILNENAMTVNLKLSDIYYIDGMTFEYDSKEGKINQILKLIKRGITSGYANKHSMVGMPLFNDKPTLDETEINTTEQDIV